MLGSMRHSAYRQHHLIHLRNEGLKTFAFCRQEHAKLQEDRLKMSSESGEPLITNGNVEACWEGSGALPPIAA